MELVIIVDYVEIFAKATYNCEGSNFANQLLTVFVHIAIRRLDNRSPNAKVVAIDLSKGSATYKKSLIHYARTCVQSGITCFNHQIESSVKLSLLTSKQEGCFLH